MKTLKKPQPQPQLSTELKLLIACLRNEFSGSPSQTAIPPKNSQLELMRQYLADQTIDWPYILKTAQAHGVLPLVCQQLQANCLEQIPKPVLEQLRRFFKANAINNMALTNELLNVVTLFQNAHIPILAFKGSTLGELAYGDFILRQFLDMDVLIPQAELEKARQLLDTHQYIIKFNLNSQRQKFHSRLAYELDFRHSQKDMALDLHWGLLPRFYSFTPDPALAWATQQQINLDNHIVPTLSVETLLLYLCAHGAKHSWTSLGMICDVAALITRQKELDWEWVETHAGKLGSSRMLRVSLYLAQHLLGATLPGNIRKKIEADPTIKTLAQQVEYQIFQPEPAWLVRLTRANFYLKSMEYWQDKIWFWIDIFTTPRPSDLLFVPLPAFLLPLHYPFRGIRIVLKFSKFLKQRDRFD